MFVGCLFGERLGELSEGLVIHLHQILFGALDWAKRSLPEFLRLGLHTRLSCCLDFCRSGFHFTLFLG
jgi:hypothetical protein